MTSGFHPRRLHARCVVAHRPYVHTKTPSCVDVCSATSLPMMNLGRLRTRPPAATCARACAVREPLSSFSTYYSPSPLSHAGRRGTLNQSLSCTARWPMYYGDGRGASKLTPAIGDDVRRSLRDESHPVMINVMEICGVVWASTIEPGRTTPSSLRLSTLRTFPSGN
jgi:hypothetical protein